MNYRNCLTHSAPHNHPRVPTCIEVLVYVRPEQIGPLILVNYCIIIITLRVRSFEYDNHVGTERSKGGLIIRERKYLSSKLYSIRVAISRM